MEKEQDSSIPATPPTDAAGSLPGRPGPGRFSGLQAGLWLTAAPAVGAIAAWGAMVGQFYWAPLLLFPVVVGVGLGALLVGLLRVAQIGHRPTIFAGAILAAAVAVVGQHYLSLRDACWRYEHRPDAEVAGEGAVGLSGEVPRLEPGTAARIPPVPVRPGGFGTAAGGRLQGEGRSCLAQLDGRRPAAAGGRRRRGHSRCPATLLQPLPQLVPHDSQQPDRGGNGRAAGGDRCHAAGAAHVTAARCRLSNCTGGCGPTRLELSWEEGGGRTFLTVAWLGGGGPPRAPTGRWMDCRRPQPIRRSSRGRTQHGPHHQHRHRMTECLRIARLIERHGEQFVNRVTRPRRSATARTGGRRRSILPATGRPEAVLKALGIGGRRGVVWRDIEIHNSPGGRPEHGHPRQRQGTRPTAWHRRVFRQYLPLPHARHRLCHRPGADGDDEGDEEES